LDRSRYLCTASPCRRFDLAEAEIIPVKIDEPEQIPTDLVESPVPDGIVLTSAQAWRGPADESQIRRRSGG
jgi:hypothetical protein